MSDNFDGQMKGVLIAGAIMILGILIWAGIVGGWIIPLAVIGFLTVVCAVFAFGELLGDKYL